MKYDNNTIALICVTGILIASILTGTNDSNIVIAGVSGILGWMAKSSTAG